MSTPGESREAVLAAIKSFTKMTGYPPTVAEIGVMTGLARTTTTYHLRKLRKDGVITFETNKPRTIQIVDTKKRKAQ